jgi:thiol-disulfide isomerase/thioredoxin
MTITIRRAAAPALLLVAALAVAACGGAASPDVDPTAAPAATPAPASVAPPEATPTPAADGGTASPATPETTPEPAVALDQPWATAELVDVATGEGFTIAELVAAGRPVVLETMAIWCSNCLAQQRRIEEALERTGPESVAYVVLTVDPAEDAAKLARYREQNGFDGMYAVADRATSRALAAEFGDQVLNPPATPVVLISPSGRVTLTGYGPKSVDEIAALVEEHRS